MVIIRISKSMTQNHEIFTKHWFEIDFSIMLCIENCIHFLTQHSWQILIRAGMTKGRTER